MAKTTTKTKVNLKKKAEYPEVTTVKTLEEQYGLDGKTLRTIIRSCGLRAPKTDKPDGAMGPTHKYVFRADNDAHVKQLDVIHAAIGNFIDVASAAQQ